MHFPIRGCHPLWPAFPDRSHNAFNTSLRHQLQPKSPPIDTGEVCGPTTPRSPFESQGLGCSEFARHYCRTHFCFLFLWVLRWFTSPGSLRAAMYSLHDTERLHSVGSPIRKSPDHRLLASPRSLSQLATSFFACLRQGIHTHALSSLTIKLTPHTFVQELFSGSLLPPTLVTEQAANLCCYPSDIQLSKIKIESLRLRSLLLIAPRNNEQKVSKMVGLGRLELPTSPLSGVRSSHLSYRPNRFLE